MELICNLAIRLVEDEELKLYPLKRFYTNRLGPGILQIISYTSFFGAAICDSSSRSDEYCAQQHNLPF